MLFSVKGFRDFLKRCPWICPLVLAVLVLAYGGKVIYQTVSLDLEIMMDSPNCSLSGLVCLRKMGPDPL